VVGSLLHNGYRVFPGVKSARAVTLTLHPLLVPWSWNNRAIPLLPLWAVQPVQSLSACTRVVGKNVQEEIFWTSWPLKMGPIGGLETSVRMCFVIDALFLPTFALHGPWRQSPEPNFFLSLPSLWRGHSMRERRLHWSSKFSSRLAARRGRCRGYWGIFGVTPDNTLLGFPSGTFLFICAYIYWWKRLHTEWVLGLCNWITNYFSKEHQFTVDGYLIFWCVCVCVSVHFARGSSFHCVQKKWDEVHGITTLQGAKSKKSADLINFSVEPWYHAQYVLQINMTVNRHCFPIQHWPTGLSNGSTVCSLRDADSIYMQIEFSFWEGELVSSLLLYG